jgi:hypothetical protein
LLAARREWAALRDRRHTVARLLNDASSSIPAILLLQRGGEDGISAVANLTKETLSMDALGFNAEKLLLSTEDPRYGGNRAAHFKDRILPHELLVFDGGGGQP